MNRRRMPRIIPAASALLATLFLASVQGLAAPSGPIKTIKTVAALQGATNGAFFQAADGSFYGATVRGGLGGYGTIYHVALSGERTTLHEFGADTGPPKFLVLGKDGQLYGTCSGLNGLDTLFRLGLSGTF